MSNNNILVNEDNVNLKNNYEKKNEPNVKLISYTKNVNDNNNLEEIIVYCARISNPTNQNSNLNNSKLIEYLIKNAHWSPFEMVSICIEINTTRDITRQILRHKSFSFQEFSQRYAEVNLGFKLREARIQDKKNRQNSIETQDYELKEKWNKMQNDINNITLEAYQWAISNNIAKEQARVILPEGNTMSKIYMNGTLRSWIHYIELRSGNGTQKEHQEIAIECAKAIEPIFPLIINFISK
jgi:thymidylate synthase (FAD)